MKRYLFILLFFMLLMPVLVMAEDKLSSNNYLSSLTISNGEINFKKDKYGYDVVVNHDVERITIKAVLEDKKAMVSGTGSKSLKDGENVFKIAVKAENGSVRNYTITIFREKDEPINEEKNVDNAQKVENTKKEMEKSNFSVPLLVAVIGFFVLLFGAVMAIKEE